jgi:hypothetical protein
MENLITGDDYEKAKKEAELLYSQIGRVWCPVISDFVYFGKIGFHHLIQKGKKFRPRSEQQRRFLLLIYAKDILSDLEVHCDNRRDQNNPDVHYWDFTAHRENAFIKVIVIQIKNGKKYFLSIYTKKQKPTL